ncbi:MAG: oligosaccharide flippase family protein [Candidatus Cloacimonetes bacterium]|nr:oligosaccharide flippase family protein [Candidatus Cloacimonadota bacterium]
MLSQLKKTISHTLIYSIGNLSTKIIGLILLPLYTTKLSLLNYGKFSILEITVMFLTMVLGLRIVSSMMRWSAETNDKCEQGKILFNTYSVLFITAILVNVIFTPLRPLLSELFFGTDNYSHFFTIILVIVGFEMLNQVPMNWLRFQGKPLAYSIFFITKLMVVLSFNIYFLVYAQIGIIGIFYSQLIANIAQMLLTLPILLKRFTYVFDTKLIKEMLGYSIPLIFSAISVQLLAIGDRYIIKHLLGYSQVGIYSLGMKIGGVLNVFVVQAFALGFLPIAYKMLHSPDAKLFYRKIFKYLVMILVFCALGLSLFSREVLLLFAKKPEFLIAYKVVPLITITYVFKGMQYMFMLGFHYVKKTKLIAYIVSVALLINIALNFLLIPIYGIWGAALATVFSSFLIAVISYYISQKFYYVNYEIGKMLIVLLAGIIIYFVSNIFAEANIYLQIIYKATLCAFFPILLYFFKFYEKTELDKMKKVINKFRK